MRARGSRSRRSAAVPPVRVPRAPTWLPLVLRRLPVARMRLPSRRLGSHSLDPRSPTPTTRRRRPPKSPFLVAPRRQSSCPRRFLPIPLCNSQARKDSLYTEGKEHAPRSTHAGRHRRLPPRPPGARAHREIERREPPMSEPKTTSRWRAALSTHLLTDAERGTMLAGIQKVAPQAGRPHRHPDLGPLRHRALRHAKRLVGARAGDTPVIPAAVPRPHGRTSRRSAPREPHPHRVDVPRLGDAPAPRVGRRGGEGDAAACAGLLHEGVQATCATCGVIDGAASIPN